MKNAGRPVGSRIREVLAVLEKTGEATVTEMRIWLPHIERSNLSKYCRRAARREAHNDQRRPPDALHGRSGLARVG